MSNYAKGKHAMAISDRSGMAFPYNEMRKEWNGMFVHKSEYESKHPQLDLEEHLLLLHLLVIQTILMV